MSYYNDHTYQLLFYLLQITSLRQRSHRDDSEPRSPLHYLVSLLLDISSLTATMYSTSRLEIKSANIVPLFKNGDRSTPSNYRPISLTYICSKLLEHIVHSHIHTHLTKCNVLCDQQHGFCQRRSCET